MKSRNSFVFIIFLQLLLSSCRHEYLLPWAENDAALSHSKLVFIPLTKCDDETSKYELEGFHSYRFAEAGGKLVINDYKEKGLHVADNAVFVLKIMGDTTINDCGRLVVTNGHNHLYLTLNRFYSRSLSVANLYLMDRDNSFLLLVTPVNQGLHMEDYSVGKASLQANEAKKLTLSISSLSKTEIKLISTDLKQNNINKSNALHYENYLSQFLAHP